MLHLSHLCFVLFTLCKTSAEVEKTDLVPGAVKIWNLSGSEASLTDNITKFVGFPDGKSFLKMRFLESYSLSPSLRFSYETLIAYVHFSLHARALHKRRGMYNVILHVQSLRQRP
ncbi:hypothetical protein OESDEN_11718 [Oesophagostomum dentatum]|uniref:Transthyretin-like family protein n=1 Tax=Oesophagostomum dentatum TaxID=61180 RepID=A0A0B1SZ67_OESDE|nr:hypothetical protein OESDEN_11718 [Oesophagostomum dentatum]